MQVETMRRRKLETDETKGVWSYNPDSIDEVIGSRIRQERHTKRILSETAKGNASNSRLNRSSMGLNDAEIGTIRREATTRFFNGAKLSDELREERERFRERYIERREEFAKNRQDVLNHLPGLQSLSFARACDAAVRRATGEFADMLTQAVIARRGRKDFSLMIRTEMWRACLSFAMGLAHWETASVWVDRAWGSAPRESPVPLSPGADPKEQMEVAKAFSAEFRKVFEERMRHGSPQWLDEAERRIELRVLLSTNPPRRVALEDLSKKAVASLFMINPSLTTGEMCAKLDSRNDTIPRSAPVPRAWAKRGVRSWVDARSKFRGSVDTYISSVRKSLPR